MNKQSLSSKILVSVFGLFMVFPFVWMISSSLKTGGEAFQTPPTLIPKKPTLENYRLVFEYVDLPRLFMNSLFIAFVVVSLQLTSSALAGYAFARLKFKGKNFFFVIYLATMMIPFQVILVPLFIEMRKLGLIDNYLGLILPTFTSAFGVFLMRQVMLGIPKELEEAAILDGASHFRLFRSIALPLCIPSLATLGILGFMGTWNGFLWPLVMLYSPEKMTLPLGLALLSGEHSTATDWPMVMAGTTLSVIPIVIVYLIFQRQIAQSFLTAGLKG